MDDTTKTQVEQCVKNFLKRREDIIDDGFRIPEGKIAEYICGQYDLDKWRYGWDRDTWMPYVDLFKEEYKKLIDSIGE